MVRTRTVQSISEASVRHQLSSIVHSGNKSHCILNKSGKCSEFLKSDCLKCIGSLYISHCTFQSDCGYLIAKVLECSCLTNHNWPLMTMWKSLKQTSQLRSWHWLSSVVWRILWLILTVELFKPSVNMSVVDKKPGPGIAQHTDSWVQSLTLIRKAWVGLWVSDEVCE